MGLEKILGTANKVGNWLEITSAYAIKKLDYPKPLKNEPILNHIKYYITAPLRLAAEELLLVGVGGLYGPWQKKITEYANMNETKPTKASLIFGAILIAGGIAAFYKLIPEDKIPHLPILLKIPSSAAYYWSKYRWMAGVADFGIRITYFSINKGKKPFGCVIPFEGIGAMLNITGKLVKYSKEITKNHPVSQKMGEIHKSAEDAFKDSGEKRIDNGKKILNK